MKYSKYHLAILVCTFHMYVRKPLSFLKPFFIRAEQLQQNFKIIPITAVQIRIDYHSCFSVNRGSD